MANNSHQQSLTVTTVMGNARCLSAYKQAAIQIFCKGMPMAYPGCWKFPQVDLQKTLPGCGSAGQQLASKFSEALLESLARLLRCASPSMLSAAHSHACSGALCLYIVRDVEERDGLVLRQSKAHIFRPP